MPSPPPPLYLDEDVSKVRDSEQLGRPDAEQLAYAVNLNSVLLTHNRSDFERLHRERLEAGNPHAGIIIARRRSPSEVAARIGRLLSRLGAEELRNQLFYV